MDTRRVITVLIIMGLLLLLYRVIFKEASYADSDPNNLHRVDSRVLKIYRSQINSRKAALTNVPDSNDFSIFYNVIVPEVFCRDLVRIGTTTDGGKWICNPSRMLNFTQCTIYSLGIADDPSFDEHLQTFLDRKCKLRSFDSDNQKPETLSRIKYANGEFMKALISSRNNQSNNEFTFKEILKKFGDKRIDILKIDIEGAEYLISDELVSVPICQILIEIHGESAKNTLKLLQKLSKNGFYLYSYEINGLVHNLSEYSLIHENCLEDYDVHTLYGKYLS